MSGYKTIKSDEDRRPYCRTHEKDGEVQTAVTLTPATTKVEKKNKDTSGGAIERVRRRDIPYPEVREVG